MFDKQQENLHLLVCGHICMALFCYPQIFLMKENNAEEERVKNKFIKYT